MYTIVIFYQGSSAQGATVHSVKFSTPAEGNRAYDLLMANKPFGTTVVKCW